ncbi:MAG: ribonuclease HII [Gammaproteobacteria bacterium CG11_big_fil_rev_8_21_14_0_20_46_22]|nr:MAG: ribonuclease HII [Gammaproteobacteria bacterium CG12_big_fil_rev_8_21_14_0_65_46_12]PIR11363.1 MAG: ribonuclease HII [Gammaproteobacteria bacterium CG11_big_fil_rev_8_21_14_0_20_46_22]
MLIAGVDEVGRGPLIGNVVTAAVILDPNRPIQGLMDSKKLSEKKRESLFDEICEKALAYAFGECTPQEIDTHNIFQATFIAMQRAVAGLSIPPNKIFVDGKFCPEFACEAQAVIKGDSKIPEISAASIIAKVTRDRQMYALHEQFPQYGFNQHKGYPTKAHLAAIEQYGVLNLHRRSYAPIKARLALGDYLSMMENG